MAWIVCLNGCDVRAVLRSVFGFDGQRKEGAIEGVTITIATDKADAHARLTLDAARALRDQLDAAINAAEREAGCKSRWETL